MVDVCLQCGDVGFSVALIHCHGCKLHLIHRYCLHPFPGFDDFVLWFCEDCEPKFISLSKSDKLPIVVKGSNYAILQKVPAKKRKRRVKRRLWSKKKSQKIAKAASPSTKVNAQTLNVEPLIQKDEIRPRIENLPTDSALHEVEVQPDCVKICDGNAKEEQQVSKRKKKRVKKANQKRQKNRLKKDTINEASLSDIPLLEYNCSKVREQDEEEAAVEQDEPLPSRDTQVVVCETPLQTLTGETIDTEIALKEGNPNKEDDCNNSPQIQPAGTDGSAEPLYDVCALPIKDPSWRGSLSIFDRVFETSTRLAAHLSSLACPRVTEATKALPELLSTDLFPRLDIWPKGFQKCRPSGHSIALYFFPDRACDEKISDKLVKRMIDQDLGIKSVLEDAELLIFTSTVLPMEYCRFQKKVYLWGVFRGKQPSVNVAAAGASDEKGHAQNTGSPVSPLSNGSD